MQLDQTVEFYIKTTSMALKRMYNKIGAEYGITQTIGFVLVYIHKEGIAPGKLAEKLGMRKSSLTRLLSKLEKDGWITRKADNDDKRIIKLYLTPLGLDKRRVAKETVINFNQEILDQVETFELEDFIHVSNLITEQVEKEVQKE